MTRYFDEMPVHRIECTGTTTRWRKKIDKMKRRNKARTRVWMGARSTKTTKRTKLENLA